MATGRSMQLTKQIGEYLVASELARRELLVATFSGSVPTFDLLAANSNGTSLPVQVKTIRGGSWQFSAKDFVEISMDGPKQVLGKKVVPEIPHLMCVFVLATEYGKDRFFILEWEELQDIVITSYGGWLADHGGKRPKKPDSLHCSVNPNLLKDYEDKWNSITDKTGVARPE